MGNDLRSWPFAVGAALITLLLLRQIRFQLRRRLVSRSRSSPLALYPLLHHIIRRTRIWWFLIISIYVGSYLLDLSSRQSAAVETLVVVGTLIQGALWGSVAIRYLLRHYIDRRLASDPSTATTVRFLGFVGRLILWTVVVLLIMANLEIEVGPLLAGLGVGGIAVALAVQTVLGDILASLSITLDRPFVVGDFIIVDDLLGTVEHVGIKTTRVKSLWGEQLVFSNNDLLQSRIRNYKQMQERRITFEFRVAYRTPRSQLAEIPEMVRKAVEDQPLTRFDRAHFHAFGASSFDFEVVYYMLDPDYNVYMDTQQAINLEIVRHLEEAGIELAYPTQVVYTGNPARESPTAALGS